MIRIREECDNASNDIQCIKIRRCDFKWDNYPSVQMNVGFNEQIQHEIQLGWICHFYCALKLRFCANIEYKKLPAFFIGIACAIHVL